jgi:acetyltransferase-like isoleucine patch superfamily enzyme
MFGNNGTRIASLLIRFLPVSRCHGLKSWLLRRLGGIKVGRACHIWSGSWFVGKHIAIGDNCFISGGAVISGLSPEGNISIGNNCDIGPDVYITTGSHHVGSATRRSGKGIFKPIRIGDGSAISVRAIVLAGVSIGPGSWIGPGVAVSRDVPPNTLVGQANVRFIKLPRTGIDR